MPSAEGLSVKLLRGPGASAVKPAWSFAGCFPQDCQAGANALDKAYHEEAFEAESDPTGQEDAASKGSILGMDTAVPFALSKRWQSPFA